MSKSCLRCTIALSAAFGVAATDTVSDCDMGRKLALEGCSVVDWSKPKNRVRHELEDICEEKQAHYNRRKIGLEELQVCENVDFATKEKYCMELVLNQSDGFCDEVRESGFDHTSKKRIVVN
eukprot:UN28358